MVAAPVIPAAADRTSMSLRLPGIIAQQVPGQPGLHNGTLSQRTEPTNRVENTNPAPTDVKSDS